MDEPTATIIAFPVDERMLHVRMVARRLRRRLAEGGATACARAKKTELNRMMGRLQVDGLSPVEISMRLCQFEGDLMAQMDIFDEAEASGRHAMQGGAA